MHGRHAGSDLCSVSGWSHADHHRWHGCLDGCSPRFRDSEETLGLRVLESQAERAKGSDRQEAAGAAPGCCLLGVLKLTELTDTYARDRYTLNA